MRIARSMIMLILSSCASLSAQDRPSQDGLNICGQWFWLGMSADEVLRKIPNKCQFDKVSNVIQISSKDDRSSWRIFLEGDKVHDLIKTWRLSGGSEAYEIGKAIADAITGASAISPVTVSTTSPPAKQAATAQVWIYRYNVPANADYRSIVISFGKRAVTIGFSSYQTSDRLTGIQIEEAIQTSVREKTR